VAGGVVAYQVGWVIFLAPYAVLAQPIHTAILPELVTEAREHGPARVGRSLRWALERMAVLVVPATAGMMALALPAMRIVSFGETGPEDSEILAGAVAGLAAGLLPYSAFLLLARGCYALGDSRTPGVVSVASALAGIVVMVVGAMAADGAAKIFVLGLGHSVAYLVGVGVLGVILVRRTGVSLWPAGFARIAAVSTVVGLGTWAVSRAVLDASSARAANLVVVAGLGLAGAGLVVAGYRVLGVRSALSVRTPVPPAADAPEVLA
jgi:putative peptidoglycan lipid II flippase